MTDDAGLLQLYSQQGDPEAFRELVGRYGDLVFGVCLRVNRNAADAQDVAQECFLELARKAGTINTSLPGWLHRVAKCKAVSFVRSQARRSLREESVAANEGVDKGEDKITWTQLGPHVDSAIDALPDELRIPFVMFYLEGRKQEEIAETLGVARSTAWLHIQNGLEEVRKKLKEDGVLGVPAAALGVLLTANGHVVAPVSLATAAVKMAISGIGSVPAAGNAVYAGVITKIAAGLALSAVAVGATIYVAQKRNLGGSSKTSIAAVTKGGATLKGNGGTLIGSAAFMPSPERPFGWRGDGTGRFPGATPPAEWSRIAKTSLTDLRCQSVKPKKNSDPGKAPKLGCSDGLLWNWLVLGPIELKDKVQTIDDETIPGEARFRPDRGEKAPSTPSMNSGQAGSGQAGDLAWNEVSLINQEYESTFKREWKKLAGSDPTPEQIKDGAGNNCFFLGVPLFEGKSNAVAYAHTYVYSANDQTDHVVIRHPGGGFKVWVNGEKTISTNTIPNWPGKAGFSLKLTKGWNSILVKSVKTGGKPADGPVGSWFFTFSLCPQKQVTAYETKNIKWAAFAPHGWHSSPVIAGDKILVADELSDILCYDRHTGRLLWIRSNNYFDAATDEERQNPIAKEKVEPLAGQLKALDEELVKTVNAKAASELAVNADPSFIGKVEDVGRRRMELIQKIDGSMHGVDPKRFATGLTQRWGLHSPTPVTDGRNVYVWFTMLTASCYDLDGNRKWCRITDCRKGSTHHGNHASPVLVDGKFIVSDAAVMAYDAETGKLLWKNTISDPQYSVPSLVKVNVGKETAVFQYMWPAGGSKFILTRDGATLWDLSKAGKDRENMTSCCSGFIVEDRTMFRLEKGGFNCGGYFTIQLPDDPDDQTGPKVQKRLGATNCSSFLPHNGDSSVASPLYLDGLIYHVDLYGRLSVFDAVKHELVYEKALDVRPREFFACQVGACASPALGGKYIYVLDNSGIVIVLEPGRKFKQVARNTIETLMTLPWGWNGNWYDRTQETLSTPVFQGKDMYLRAQSWLYCISEEAPAGQK